MYHKSVRKQVFRTFKDISDISTFIHSWDWQPAQKKKKQTVKRALKKATTINYNYFLA